MKNFIKRLKILNLRPAIVAEKGIFQIFNKSGLNG